VDVVERVCYGAVLLGRLGTALGFVVPPGQRRAWLGGVSAGFVVSAIARLSWVDVVEHVCYSVQFR
jgi:hypothetical protein